jgi:hypothetical protein
LSHSLSLFCYPPVADSIPPKGADILIAQPDDANASNAKSSGDSLAMSITTGEGPKGVLVHASLTKKERKAAKKSALKEAKKTAKRAAKMEEKKEAKRVKRAAKMEEKRESKKEAKRLERAASTTTGTSPAQIEASNKRQENAGAAFSHSSLQSLCY